MSKARVIIALDEACEGFDALAPTFAGSTRILDAVRAARFADIEEHLIRQVLRECLVPESLVPESYAGPDCGYCNGDGTDASGEACRGCWATGCETVNGRGLR